MRHNLAICVAQARGLAAGPVLRVPHHGDGQRSSTTSTRVFVSNVSDEAPVLEPPAPQIYRPTEGAQSGLAEHAVQAHDTDGDNITPAFQGE
jgi:beta-lactamase superfamily II metal-dependent hydrolase